MPFIPHTKDDKDAMLKAIGVTNIDSLFDEIPQSLRNNELDTIAKGQTEMALRRSVAEKVKNISDDLSFLGAGSYHHHIPAAVWDIASRGEYLTAYTPYQAEASQASLQLIYEYQTMMAKLTGMDVSNASMYDGASALAEAALMAVRAQKKNKANAIVLTSSLHPFYRQTVKNIVGSQNIELIDLPFDEASGTCLLSQLESVDCDNVAGVIIAQPNFFGALEAVDEITNWAHKSSIKVIACVNPLSLALLKPPGEWGEKGADIVCGDGQPLGVPMASGGPYYGFLTCKEALIRQIPGRIVGRTIDSTGQVGYTLTLQAREQHIRRSRATSNICTNQGLLVTASTIYMSLMGEVGLKNIAKTCHQNMNVLLKSLASLKGVTLKFGGAYFHEVVLAFDKPVSQILEKMSEQKIMAGLDLGRFYPQFDNCLMVCVTETKTKDDIAYFVSSLEKTLAAI